MKRVWVSYVIIVLVVVALGALFVFGDTVSDIASGKSDFFKGDSSEGNGEDSGDKESSGDESTDGTFSSGGGSGGGGSGGSSECTEFQQVQYSITDFIEEAECLVYGIGTCDSVKITCSSRLSNLDSGFGGKFTMKYSIVSGNETLSVKEITETIGPRENGVFGFETIMNGSFNTGNMGCVIDIENAPMKPIC